MIAGNDITNLFYKIRILKQNRHYRLGDLFFAHGMRWEYDRNVILTDTKYKHSIMYQYLSTLNNTESKNQEWSSLIKILKNKSQIPKNEFSVHIRCGDIATDNKHHKPCFIFNPDALVDKIAKKLDKTTSTISIVTAMHYGANNLLDNKYTYTQHNYDVNRTLISNILMTIRNKFKLPIVISQYPSIDIKFIDEQFLELIFSDKCVLDHGGFGKLVSTVRSKMKK